MPSGIRRRRAAKSGITKATRRGRAQKTKSRDINANPIIAEHWDHDLTLTQNYRRLGLASKLQKPAGGVEKDARKKVQDSEVADLKRTNVKEGRIVHNEDGSTSIVYEQAEFDQEATPVESKTDVVRQLEDYAKTGVTENRHQSEREQDWLEALVAKHGDDYKAMQWDKKLNKFQQSAGDIKRRIKKLQVTKA